MDVTPTCAVAIPVYKEDMDTLEKKSFCQCVRVLGRRDLYLVTYPELDCSLYESIAEEAGVKLKKQLFDNMFFKDVAGYNRLMLDRQFYQAFATYTHLLIYQLDAYVFSDDLDYWCGQGYDYVGAPWFDGFGRAESGSLYTVGNGGFSLRRIAYFINLLTTRRGIFSYSNLPTDSGIITKLKFLAGGYNHIDSLIRRNTINEDHFYCIVLKDSKFPPILPSPQEAARFAFEQSPAYLYKLIGNRLPMGCHAFEKYEYHTFWLDKIN